MKQYVKILKVVKGGNADYIGVVFEVVGKSDGDYHLKALKDVSRSMPATKTTIFRIRYCEDVTKILDKMKRLHTKLRLRDRTEAVSAVTGDSITVSTSNYEVRVENFIADFKGGTFPTKSQMVEMNVLWNTFN